MNLKTNTFDPADHLKTPEEIAAFLNDALETGSPDEVVHALGIAARAHGMTQVAKDTDLGRESLYKAFRPGARPEFATALKVMRSLGLSVVTKPTIKKVSRRIAKPIPQKAMPKRVAVKLA